MALVDTKKEEYNCNEIHHCIRKARDYFESILREKLVITFEKGIFDRKRQYRTIYGLLSETYRIPVKSISAVIGRTAGRRLREAIEQQRIIGPGKRKKSRKSLREYTYFVNFKNPNLLYSKYRISEVSSATSPQCLNGRTAYKINW